LPHSEISGSPGARPSPELFAACHVLHRLSVPRHPPDALLVLAHAQPQGRAKRGQRTENREQRTDQTVRRRTPSSDLWACVSIAPTGVAPGVLCIPMPGHDRSPAQGRSQGGGSCHARFTVTTRFTMSKTPAPHAPFQEQRADPRTRSGLRRLVGLGRLERPTSRLSGVRSNQLSYRPGFREQRSENRPAGASAARADPTCLSSVFCPLEGMRGRRPGRFGDAAGVPGLAAGPGGPADWPAHGAGPLERR
jgi:hypothetical protein